MTKGSATNRTEGVRMSSCGKITTKSLMNGAYRRNSEIKTLKVVGETLLTKEVVNKLFEVFPNFSKITFNDKVMVVDSPFRGIQLDCLKMPRIQDDRVRENAIKGLKYWALEWTATSNLT